MIKVKGNKAIFSGKDETILRQEAKRLGLSPQDAFTGILWELIMQKARKGVFLEKAKNLRK